MHDSFLSAVSDLHLRLQVVLHVALLSPWTNSVLAGNSVLGSVCGWLSGSTSPTSCSGYSSTTGSFTVSVGCSDVLDSITSTTSTGYTGVGSTYSTTSSISATVAVPVTPAFYNSFSVSYAMYCNSCSCCLSLTSWSNYGAHPHALAHSGDG